MKPWIHKQAPTLKLHNNASLGAWLSELPLDKWIAGMNWVDLKMNDKRANSSLNDHWNNHIRFCAVMEPYMTLSYAVKHGDIGLLRNAIREVCVILQAPAAAQPKYARTMLRQLHIFDTKASDLLLQETYLANALVNLCRLPHTFYELDLLLEHQNGGFKRFRTDRGSSLQESDKMFRLHALSVDYLQRVRLAMNGVIIRRDRTDNPLNPTIIL